MSGGPGRGVGAATAEIVDTDPPAEAPDGEGAEGPPQEARDTMPRKAHEAPQRPKF
jgi:hypothetical protein